ncbi:hypothetical protein [Alloprevotella tannerae]|uniref:hypothetical protein n=1 Tax=Alloprevotella tannerae TaxID=76122 RepID=UPI0028EE7571|nr:hypothetical protein [Alloprevotella tannerae]
MITKFASYRQVPIRGFCPLAKDFRLPPTQYLIRAFGNGRRIVAFRPHKPRIAKSDKAARRQESRINLE